MHKHEALVAYAPTLQSLGARSNPLEGEQRTLVCVAHPFVSAQGQPQSYQLSVMSI